jgi:hypothetical protein
MLAHDRFHLIFQAKFNLFQAMFLYLLVVGQVRQRFQRVQFMCVLRVLVGELAKLLVRSHQMRFKFIFCNPFHIGQFLPVRLPRRVGLWKARWVISVDLYRRNMPSSATLT